MALGNKPKVGVSSGAPINPNMLGGGGGVSGFAGVVNPPVPTETILDPYHFGDDATVDADGNATIALPTVGFWVYVDRIVINNTGATQCVCSVYVGNAGDPKFLADSSNAGLRDVADENQPIRVPPNTTCSFVWSGAEADSISTVSVFYRQARGTS